MSKNRFGSILDNLNDADPREIAGTVTDLKKTEGKKPASEDVSIEVPAAPASDEIGKSAPSRKDRAKADKSAADTNDKAEWIRFKVPPSSEVGKLVQKELEKMPVALRKSMTANAILKPFFVDRDAEIAALLKEFLKS